MICASIRGHSGYDEHMTEASVPFRGRPTQARSLTASFCYSGLSADWQMQLIEWIKRMGLEVSRLALDTLVEQRSDGAVVHFREYLLDDRGSKFLAGNGEEAATRRVTVPADDAPEWVRNLVIGRDPGQS